MKNAQFILSYFIINGLARKRTNLKINIEGKNRPVKFLGICDTEEGKDKKRKHSISVQDFSRNSTNVIKTLKLWQKGSVWLPSKMSYKSQ